LLVKIFYIATGHERLLQTSFAYYVLMHQYFPMD